MQPAARILLVSYLAAAASAGSAGTVDVAFLNARTYADAGNAPWEEESNLQALARHLQALGQRLLPASHVLKVEVLDVDLAGTVRPSARGPELRVLRGGADFPRIHLQYTLEVDGKPHGSAKEWVTDLNYSRGLADGRGSESLHYEKRMLASWFKARFVDGRPAAG